MLTPGGGFQAAVDELLQLDDADGVDEHGRVVTAQVGKVADNAPQPLLHLPHRHPHLQPHVMGSVLCSGHVPRACDLLCMTHALCDACSAWRTLCQHTGKAMRLPC